MGARPLPEGATRLHGDRRQPGTEWFRAEGRDRYTFDFTVDDELLEHLRT